MGYYTHVTGRIEIDPPIPWGAFKDSPFQRTFVDVDTRPFLDVAFEVDETETYTAEGLVLVRRAVAVVPVLEDSYKAYYIVENLQALVDDYPEHRFVGCLEGEGEEQGDVWRLRVNDDHEVEKIKPEIVWPD